jgi:hypothetical protein
MSTSLVARTRALLRRASLAQDDARGRVETYWFWLKTQDLLIEMALESIQIVELRLPVEYAIFGRFMLLA